jgi:hypothetical protein
MTFHESYGNDPEAPFFGPDQGSTPGPFLWLLLFILIAQSIKGYPGISLSNPSSSIQLQTSGNAFVDDSYLIASAYDQSNPAYASVQALQLFCQRWERSLFTTGGAINLLKSFWIVMAWKWFKGKALLLPPSLHNLSLSLTLGCSTDKPVTVPQLSPYDAYRTLGAYILPSVSQEKAFQVLKHHALQYASKIQSSFLTKEATLWSYKLYLIPMISFSVMATLLTKDQCHRIQSREWKSRISMPYRALGSYNF